MSARAVVLVREMDGARQIHYLPSTAPEPEIRDDFMIALSKARLLHLNGRHENVARLAVREAQRAGVTISWDGGAGRYRDSIRDLVEASHLRIVSVDFARKMTGLHDPFQMAKALLLPPACLVVVTAGTSGCYIAQPGEPVFIKQPIPPAGSWTPPAVVMCFMGCFCTAGCVAYRPRIVRIWLPVGPRETPRGSAEGSFAPA